MAIKIYEQFAPFANPADGDYPYGSIKNDSIPGAEDGTPLDAVWANDYAGFDAALLAEAGIAPSGNPDTVGNSQRLEAISMIAGHHLWRYGETATANIRYLFNVSSTRSITVYSNVDVVMGEVPDYTVFKIQGDAEDVAIAFGLYDGQEITSSKLASTSLYCRSYRLSAKLVGQMTLNEDVFIDFNCDAGECRVTTDNTITVGRLGTFVRSNIKVITPRVTAITRHPTIERVGIRIMGVTDSEIHVPYVANFTKNLQIYSRGAPVVFNTIYIGTLSDGYINFAIETEVNTADPAYISYANENLFIGGHLSMEPSSTLDTNRVQIYGNDRDRGINGNYWLKTSIELPTYGAGQPTDRFIRFVSGCSENFLVGVRAEGDGELRFEGSSSSNNVSLGSQSDVNNVTVVESGSAQNNYIERIGKNGSARSLFNPLVLTNSLSADRSIMDFIAPLGAGGIHNRTGNETTYSTRHLHDGVSYKKTGDTTDRFKISARTKSGVQVSKGTGNMTTANNIFSCSTNATATGASFIFADANIAQSIFQSASGINIISADVTAYRASDGKFYTGRFLALVRYVSGGDYVVISETLTKISGDFTAVTFSLGNGVGKGSTISPRVSITDGITSPLKVEVTFSISSSDNISN